MSIFEAIMMFCFGFSWPFQVAKTFKTKNVEGKSIFFLWLVIIGYLAGIFYKISGKLDWVIILYIINLILVGADTVLYYKYKTPKHSKIVTFRSPN